jgi:hypothetical protein
MMQVHTSDNESVVICDEFRAESQFIANIIDIFPGSNCINVNICSVDIRAINEIVQDETAVFDFDFPVLKSAAIASNYLLMSATTKKICAELSRRLNQLDIKVKVEIITASLLQDCSTKLVKRQRT